jgi:hypothetical protein
MKETKSKFDIFETDNEKTAQTNYIIIYIYNNYFLTFQDPILITTAKSGDSSPTFSTTAHSV